MALLLDTNDTILIAEDATDMTRQLVTLLDDDPDEETLARLAATVFGCDVLDIRRQPHRETMSISPALTPAGSDAVRMHGYLTASGESDRVLFRRDGGYLCADHPGLMDKVSRRVNRPLHRIGAHPDKATLLDSAHQSLYPFTEGLDGAGSQNEFDSRHNAWCRERIDFFTEHPRDDRAFTFTYGHAQKWLNMAAKYLDITRPAEHTSWSRSNKSSTWPIKTAMHAHH